MKRLFLMALLMMGLLLSSSSAVAAQDIETETESDFAAVAEVVLDADPEALATAIETPLTDADLPEGFLAPVDGIPENAEVVDAFSTGLGDLEGAVGSFTHGLDTDPAVVPGELSAGILTYIVAEEEITGDDLEDFAGGIEDGLDDPDATFSESSVEMVQVNGEDAVLTTLGLEESGTFVVVQMLAIPVGNTMVVSTVLSVDTAAVDAEEITPLTAELAVAGVEFLGTVAEDAA